MVLLVLKLVLVPMPVLRLMRNLMHLLNYLP